MTLPAPELSSYWLLVGPTIVGAAALASASLIALLYPYLQRRVVAHPNTRSSHRVATPQGGGIPLIGVTIASAGAAALASPGLGVAALAPLVPLLFAAVVLCIAGAVDDVRALHPLPRLLIQAIALFAVIAALPEDLRAVPAIPAWIERALLFVAGVWLVNLVNFMDGIDWMNVAEVVPITAALAALAMLGALPAVGGIVALALLGSTIGFAFFNRPVAKLFLGDAGSLPTGLLLFWLLVLLAGNGHLAAALLLPLYYVADATITLLRRLFRGERLWQAHRAHFYQRAMDRGLTALQIVGRVFAANVGLVALALFSVWRPEARMQLSALIVGCIIVAMLLTSFARGRA
jgi:UDP-N-acetylmuramyl pentapeptide phosphotransferase/UDP-N-acetylglucosamine-1-phosphate transferase